MLLDGLFWHESALHSWLLGQSFNLDPNIMRLCCWYYLTSIMWSRKPDVALQSVRLVRLGIVPRRVVRYGVSTVLTGALQVSG